MKKLAKFFALFVAVTMLSALCMATMISAAPSGKITITNAAIGRTYKLYKLLDETVSDDNRAYYVASTSPLKTALESEAGKAIFAVGEADAKGMCSVTFTDAAAAEAFLIVAVKDLITAGSITEAKKTTPVTGNTIEWTGLDLGYYYVDTASADVLITVDGSGDVSIIDKTLDKPVPPTPDDPDVPTADDRFKSIKDSDFVGVGETAVFTLKLIATNFVTESDEDKFTTKKIIAYQLTDTPVNMKIADDQGAPVVTVKVGDQQLASGKYTAVLDASGALTVTIPWVDSEKGESIYANEAEITVSYSALVTDLGASNGAGFGYKLEGDEVFTPAEVPTGEDSVEIVNGSITISANEDGGVYDLTDDQGQKIPLVKVEDGVYRPATSEDETTYTGSLSNGDVIKGLGEGDYTVEEASSPDGYNKAGDADVTIDASDDDAIDVEAEFEYNAGTVLPETGSIGTTLFVVLGAIAVIGAGIFLVTNKRMSKEII